MSHSPGPDPGETPVLHGRAQAGIYAEEEKPRPSHTAAIGFTAEGDRGHSVRELDPMWAHAQQAAPFFVPWRRFPYGRASIGGGVAKERGSGGQRRLWSAYSH